MKIFDLTVMVVACVLFLSNCTKSSSIFGGPAGTLSEDFINSMLDGKYSTVTDSISSAASTTNGSSNLIKALRSKLAFRFAASPFADCQPTFDGDRTDTDNDGAWTNATASLSCESGSDTISGSLKLIDENDNLALPNAGVYAQLSNGSLNIGITGGKRLTLTLDTSHLDFKANTATSSLDILTILTLASSAGWQFETGIEGNGSYVGNINSNAAGDTIQGSGYYKLKSTSIPNFDDVDFVISLELSLTMGTCPGKSKIEPVSGGLTIKDGVGNILQVTATDCEGTVTYNGAALRQVQIAGR